MNKRKLGSFALSVMLLVLSASADAQQPKKVHRIGYLSSVDPATDSPRSEGIRLALREIGYIEGQNIVIERRYGEGKPDQAPQIARSWCGLRLILSWYRERETGSRRPRMPPTRFPSL
jgi:putative tryptophan/tyrosine transport system substrate-binding protein